MLFSDSIYKMTLQVFHLASTFAKFFFFSSPLQQLKIIAFSRIELGVWSEVIQKEMAAYLEKIKKENRRESEDIILHCI